MKNLYLSIPLLTLALAAGTASVAQSAKPLPTTPRAQQMAEPARIVHDMVLRGGADDCGSATVLISDLACVPTAFSTAAATQDMDPILCGGFTSPDAMDVFFTFVATSETQAITVNGFEAADAVLELLEGTCGSLVSLSCSDNTYPGAADETTTEEIIQGGLTIGTSYYVRVYDYAHGSDLHNFDICVTEGFIVPPPANDLCEDVAPVDLASGSSVSFSGNNLGATDTEALGEPNVWHAFTITECANLVIDYCGTNPAFGNGFTNLWIGCPNTDNIVADSFDATTCPDGNFSLFYNNVPAGTYYYAVMLDAVNNAAGDYTINVSAAPCTAAPANDLCEDVTPVDLANGSSVSFSGNNLGALDTEGLGNGSVWHAFTTTECADLVIDYCGTNPPFGNGFTALHMGCPSSGSLTANSFDATTCPDGNFSLFYNSVPPGTYYYAVMLDAANNAAGDYTINVTASAAAIPCPDAPANDLCAGAMMLTSSVSCVPTASTTTGATQDLAPILCNGYTSPNANDVYFTFVATSTDHTITVNGFAGFDGVMEFFTGDCSNLVSVGCTDDTFPPTGVEDAQEVMMQTGLEIGTIYTVRVYDYAHGSELHNFDICVTGDIIDAISENAASAWSIFPNPANGNFSIQYAGESGLGNVEVFDVAGRTVYAERAQLNNGAVRTIALNGVSAGSYTVRITMNGVQTAQRLLVD